MMPMSSLGRFLPIVASNSANFAASIPGSAGGSCAVECTVAIPDYRLAAMTLLLAHHPGAGFASHKKTLGWAIQAFFGLSWLLRNPTRLSASSFGYAKILCAP